ncbi:MAG: ribosome silencing factor [Deltaproteobacteria bacterium]|jgi:ribosome-associated protein|nr:ribosome silencing factor [Deltaproteobacteria bacterium]
MTPRLLAKKIAQIASDHKAIDVVVLDLKKLTSFTDFFIICSGASDRQVKALADSIHYDIKSETGRVPLGVEGMRDGHWALIDYGDVVAHVFYEEVREHYQLEKLWNDAAEVKFEGI